MAGVLWLLTGLFYRFGYSYFGYSNPVIWVTVSVASLGSWICFLVAVLTLPEGGSSSVSYAAPPYSAAAAQYNAAAPSATGRKSGPVSKAFYLGSILTCCAVTIMAGLIILASYASNSFRDDDAIIGFAVVLIIPTVYLAVVIAMFLYKMWSAIQDGHARATPGQAVGFMFIPLFNLYWVFQAYYGWTRDFNTYAGSRAIPAPRMPEGLALTMCILMLCSMIPILGIVISIVNLVLLSVFVSKACDGLNAISAAPTTLPAAPGVAS